MRDYTISVAKTKALISFAVFLHMQKKTVFSRRGSSYFYVKPNAEQFKEINCN